jgi:hypothetical protein
MELELQDVIRDCRAVVEKFSHDFSNDEVVCLATQSLWLVAFAAAEAYDGVWTVERSQEVEAIFELAITSHRRFTVKNHNKRSEYEPRLLARYEDLKTIFLHGQYATLRAAQPSALSNPQ